MDATNRLIELEREFKHDWKKVAEILNNEGHKTARGNEWTARKIKDKWQGLKKKGAHDASEEEISAEAKPSTTGVDQESLSQTSCFQDAPSPNVQGIVTNELASLEQGIDSRPLVTDSQPATRTVDDSYGPEAAKQLPVNGEPSGGDTLANDLLIYDKQAQTSGALQTVGELPHEDDLGIRAEVSNNLPERNEQDITQELATVDSDQDEKDADSQEHAKHLLTDENILLIKELLTDYQSGGLAGLLDWWKRKEGAYSPTSEQRPIFKGRRRNTGLHINNRILELAAAKVKTDKHWSGGSMSLLVERLLWEYVGRPDEVLEISGSESGLHEEP